MPSISVHDLSYRLPDGQILFDKLDLVFGQERTGIVGRNGSGKSSLLRLLCGEAVPSSGSVLKEGAIAVLPQDPAARQGTVASLFGAEAPLSAIERASRGEAQADELADIDWDVPTRLEAALSRFGLHDLDPLRSLATLSGGQRTRAGVAALIFEKPDFLLLDEPTNNLDADGRDAVRELVQRWTGGLVVVSHDRALLAHVDRIVELSELGARVHGGNYEVYRQMRDAERASSLAALRRAEDDERRTALQAQQARERQQRRDAAGRQSRRGSADPKILLDARKERAESTAGRGSRLGERAKAEASQKLAEARSRIERTVPFAAAVALAELPAGRSVLSLAGVSAGFEGRIVLDGIDLTIAGPERIAVTGPNGAGKSTLLAVAAGRRAPLSGKVARHGTTTMLDQDVSILERDLSVLDKFARLNPDATPHEARAALARYAFRADAALNLVRDLSGGERLRAGLACSAGGTRAPDLLILDEPTNHLDLDAIEAVEEGLRAHRGALLVVSHDRSFLDAIGITREARLESGQLVQ